MPIEYALASQQFDAFMEDARQLLGHDSRHQTYQTVESVLRVFRRRLSVEDAISFAQALPAVLRAIFVTDWDITVAVSDFTTREVMTREVQSYRKDHDFSPETAIADVATALWRHVDPVAMRLALARLPPEAAAFWAVPSDRRGNGPS